MPAPAFTLPSFVTSYKIRLAKLWNTLKKKKLLPNKEAAYIMETGKPKWVSEFPKAGEIIWSFTRKFLK